MKPKLSDKEHAINLRKQGLTYSEILARVPVAKSTLSLWLRSVQLSKRQSQKLTQKKLNSMARGAKRKHEIRMENWERICDQAAQEVESLSAREKWLIGVALYWAEGDKEKTYRSGVQLSFGNSDYRMALIYQHWLCQAFNLKPEDIKYKLYIHQSVSYHEKQSFWAELMSVSPEKIRVYFKRHNPRTVRYNTSDSYIGTLCITVPKSTNLQRYVGGWIEGIIKNWGVV